MTGIVKGAVKQTAKGLVKKGAKEGAEEAAKKPGLIKRAVGGCLVGAARRMTPARGQARRRGRLMRLLRGLKPQAKLQERPEGLTMEHITRLASKGTRRHCGVQCRSQP
jgi:hypothetical protein